MAYCLTNTYLLTMASSEAFKAAIKEEMFRRAYTDPNFGTLYTDTKKTLDDCVTYILNQVKQSGIIGFEDKEVYDMAEHFYSTEGLDPGSKIDCRVVVNRLIQLTEEEIEVEKKKAIDKIHQEVREKVTKPKKTPVVVKPTVITEESEEASKTGNAPQINLFD